MTSMKRFDIAYEFTVVGIKTIEDFSGREVADSFKQDLIDAIQINLGDGSMLFELSQSVYPHSPAQVEFETADIMKRKAYGLEHCSIGHVPYSESAEDSPLPETETVLD